MQDSAKEVRESFYKVFFNEELYKVNNPSYNLPNSNSQIMEEPKTPYIQSSPEKKAGVTFLFNYPGKADIPLKDQLLLNNILKSVKISLEDIKWYNVASMEGGRTELLHKIDDSSHIVALGVPRLFLPGEKETGVIEENGKKWVLNKGLAEIAQDKNLKATLWAGLKEVFGIGN